LDKTARIWDARTGAQLAVLSGHADAVHSAAFSPNNTRIVTGSDDKTARVWDARVPATIAAQILWGAAAETDPLPDVDRIRLGLPLDARSATRATQGSACDQAAGAVYDPDRRAAGTAQSDIKVDFANSTCSADIAKPDHPARADYEMGRALLAKHDVRGARREFELAVARGYRAAQIDLASLLVDRSAGMLEPERAVSLYKQAWRDGVLIAAFELGDLYEVGDSGSSAATPGRLQSDQAKAWSWYQKGADAGEPNALARVAVRDDQNAVAERETSKRNALLLQAFRLYAAAAERAHDADWPDEAWRNWRCWRATLARELAREGMMQEVADAYTEIRAQWAPRPPTLWERIEARLGL
jgi:TPR repeat protein